MVIPIQAAELVPTPAFPPGMANGTGWGLSGVTEIAGMEATRNEMAA